MRYDTREGLALTPHEVRVLGLYMDGLRTPEIAVQLGIKPRTIDSQRERIKTKLGARTLVQAVAVWLRQGDIPR